MTIYRGIDSVTGGINVASAADIAAAEAAAAASAAAALVSEGLADADATATAADLVATNQDTIDTAADLVLTNADVVLTNADVVLTNADVVLTNADVVSSAASAAAALVSENAAAASAATVPAYDTITSEALNFVRLNAGETSMEFRTPVEVLADISAEPADATILKDADIGVTVQAYDATIVVDADIGVSVQAYDATIVVDADIGVSVQAYNVDTLFADTTDNLSVGITTDVEVLASDTITPDLALESLKTRSVVGNVTINVPSNGNGKCAIRLDIDGTNRTVTLGTNVLAVGTIPTLTASATFLAVVTRFSATSATVQIKEAV